MGSQTTHGFPYPVGTDRVMDGDDAIKALAQQIDTTIADARVALGIQGQALATPAAGTAIWGTVGNVDIPAWAKRARITWGVHGYTGTTQSNNSNCFVRIAGSAGNVDTPVARIVGSSSGTNGIGFTYAAVVDVSTIAGQVARPVQVMATFVAGTQTFANAQVFVVTIDWLP
jgi:hypothetical protein